MQDLFLSVVRLSDELLLVWLVWTYWISWNGNGRLIIRARMQGQARHPQNPRDCPVCRAAHGVCEAHEQRVIEAGAKQKSKRGRPKVVEADGFAAPTYSARKTRLPTRERMRWSEMGCTTPR